jgi:hypothetical protein
MSRIQTTFITLGVFWLSLWVAAAVAWPLSKLINRITYTDTIFNAFALGFMNSLGRTLAAILAGVLVTTVVSGRKSQLWALIVAVLYVVNAPMRLHLGYPATGWDRLWQSVALAVPAVTCVLAAFITASVRQKKAADERLEHPHI